MAKDKNTIIKNVKSAVIQAIIAYILVHGVHMAKDIFRVLEYPTNNFFFQHISMIRLLVFTWLGMAAYEVFENVKVYLDDPELGTEFKNILRNLVLKVLIIDVIAFAVANLGLFMLNSTMIFIIANIAVLPVDAIVIYLSGKILINKIENT